MRKLAKNKNFNCVEVSIYCKDICGTNVNKFTYTKILLLNETCVIWYMPYTLFCDILELAPVEFYRIVFELSSHFYYNFGG